MSKKYLYAFFIFFAIAIYSCSKKNHPGSSSGTATDTTTKKPVVKRKPKEPVPKVIAVSDSGARKTVDGRYYYDLDGHRYWRNNKDGKYYLFNKAMYNNDDFKPVAN